MRLKSLLAFAKRNNATLRRMRQMMRVLQQRRRRAGPWPDLQVGVRASGFPMNSFNPTTTPMSGIAYSISQRFPILKRLSLRRQLAGFDIKMLRSEMKERLSGIQFSLVRAMSELVRLRRYLALAREEYHLMGQAAAVAKTRYAVNRAPQQHMLQALTAQAQLRSRMIGLVARVKVWRHRMVLAIGHNGATLLGALPQVKAAVRQPKVKPLLVRALQQRGAALRWRYAAEKAQKLLAFARVRYWPDVTLQLSVRQRFPNNVDPGVPHLALGIRLPIPSWGNAARHGLVKEAMALHVYARRRRGELRSLWLSQAQVALARARQFSQQRKIATTQTIPLAMRAYRSALANYRVGRVDFLTLIGTIRTVYREKRKVYQLDNALSIIAAKLVRIGGVVP